MPAVLISGILVNVLTVAPSQAITGFPIAGMAVLGVALGALQRTPEPATQRIPAAELSQVPGPCTRASRR